MANRIVPNSMVKVLADFRDDNPECVIRDLLPGKVPGTWLLMQSQFPHPELTETGAPVKCEFEIKPGTHSFTGRAEFLVHGTFNLGHMVVVLGRLTSKWKQGADPKIDPSLPDWIGLQYDLTSRTGVVIFYKSLWDISWGTTEKKLG